MERNIADEFIDPERLREIREQTDWQKLFLGLMFEKDNVRSNDTDWWAYSPFRKSTKPTFHLTSKGLWYDFSIRQGGGVIELVQKVYDVNCYEAGQIILDSQWLIETDKLDQNDGNDKPVLSKNLPIRQSLLPALSEQGTHPEFTKRGISEKTCEDLGIGFLGTSKSTLKDSVVFQIRGVELGETGFKPTVLSHISWKSEQENPWVHYPNFNPSLEIYNIDQLLLNGEAKEQIKQTGMILLAQDPWDVAKCYEAGIYNVCALLGSEITDEQLEKLKLIQAKLEPENFLVWSYRAQGKDNSANFKNNLLEHNLEAESFDWEQVLGKNKNRVSVNINSSIQSPCDMSTEQILWLRKQSII